MQSQWEQLLRVHLATRSLLPGWDALGLLLAPGELCSRAVSVASPQNLVTRDGHGLTQASQGSGFAQNGFYFDYSVKLSPGCCRQKAVSWGFAEETASSGAGSGGSLDMSERSTDHRSSPFPLSLAFKAPEQQPGKRGKGGREGETKKSLPQT